MNRGKGRIQELEHRLAYATYCIVEISKDMDIVPLDDGRFLIKSPGILVSGPKETPSCKINGKAYEYYVYDDSKWYEKILRKIKKWLGIVSPTEDRPPWEEQNCDLSLKFKEDYK